MEGTSFADFAFDPDPAAHHGDQLRRDCQTQSGAAKIACCGTVRLSEGLENQLLLFEWDTDAGVGDRNMEIDLVFNFRPGLNVHHHFAVLRELDGIACQVDDDLA